MEEALQSELAQAHERERVTQQELVKARQEIVDLRENEVSRTERGWGRKSGNRCAFAGCAQRLRWSDQVVASLCLLVRENSCQRGGYIKTMRSGRSSNMSVCNLSGMRK